MVHLMPFNSKERTDYELVNELQQKCINDKTFGMGWDLECFSYGTKMTDETANDYLEKYNVKYDGEASEKSVNDYKEIHTDRDC